MKKIIQDKDESKQLYYELTPERLAILDLIAYTEGTDRDINKTKAGYNILYNFVPFVPGRDHPRRIICTGSGTNRPCSSAAGRYQILNTTWDLLQNKLRATGFRPFPSFEPIYQDQAALFLIDFKQNALTDVDSRSLIRFFR